MNSRLSALDVLSTPCGTKGKGRIGERIKARIVNRMEWERGEWYCFCGHNYRHKTLPVATKTQIHCIYHSGTMCTNPWLHKQECNNHSNSNLIAQRHPMHDRSRNILFLSPPGPGFQSKNAWEFQNVCPWEEGLMNMSIFSWWEDLEILCRPNSAPGMPGGCCYLQSDSKELDSLFTAPPSPGDHFWDQQSPFSSWGSVLPINS